MKNTRTVHIVVLLSAAIAIGLLTPVIVPAAASVNSHSLNINSSSAFPVGNYTLSGKYQIGNSTLTISGPGPNGTTLGVCSVVISQAPTSTNETIYFTIAIVPGSCHPVNG
jgi:hypothetical protein